MTAGTKYQPRSTIGRLILTVVGVLLMVGPPYAFQMLSLTPRFQTTTIAGIELSSLVVGFVLLYLALKERGPPESES